MATYKLSRAAELDLENIYVYTHKSFGETQADLYLSTLAEKCDLLSGEPALGRKVDHIRTGYRRYDCMSHSIFFRQKTAHIEIIRILHNGMDMKSHFQ